MSTRPGQVPDRCYDVIVVGGGVMGSVLAKVLAELAYKEQRSISILILEAGAGGSSPEATHQAYLETYYGALTKTPNAPYPTSVNAPSPEDLAFLKPPGDRYFVQQGKIPFGSNNLRILGGTTHHWMMRFRQANEVAHYYRFEQILAERYYDRDDDFCLSPSGPRLRVDWSAVHNIRPLSPVSSTSPSGLAGLLQAFDRTYSDLLTLIHRGFNGEPDALGEATVIMKKKLKNETIGIMRVHINNEETCGPPFWFVKTKPERVSI